MSQPASNPDEPNPANPAVTAAPPVDHEFDLLAFWIQYRKLIIRLVTMVLLAVATWGAYEFMQYRKRAGSEEALATAKSSEDLRKVVGDWEGTPAAGTAYLRLADELRKENKPEEAAKALKEFTEKYPQHPLRAKPDTPGPVRCQPARYFAGSRPDPRAKIGHRVHPALPVGGGNRLLQRIGRGLLTGRITRPMAGGKRHSIVRLVVNPVAAGRQRHGCQAHRQCPAHLTVAVAGVDHRALIREEES